MRFAAYVLALCCLVSPSVDIFAQPTLSKSQIFALTSAIEDEVYDYNLEGSYRLIGKALPGNRVEVPLFVTSDSSASVYKIIYRLMPYGEMYRLAEVSSSDGMVHLFRNPQIGFPPDAPATLTVYYDDDVICKAKSEALRLSFVIDLDPSKQILEEAVRRQVKRYGFSNLKRKGFEKNAGR